MLSSGTQANRQNRKSQIFVGFFLFLFFLLQSRQKRARQFNTLLTGSLALMHFAVHGPTSLAKIWQVLESLLCGSLTWSRCLPADKARKTQAALQPSSGNSFSACIGTTPHMYLMWYAQVSAAVPTALSPLFFIRDVETKQQVPSSWSKCYPSLKPLGAWMRDLILRAEHIRGWAMVAMPKVFWLPCMTYPSGETRLDGKVPNAIRLGRTRGPLRQEYIGRGGPKIRVG